MTISPIVQTVDVKAAPAEAFDLFAARMGRWWPLGRTVGRAPHADIVIEPVAGGRWYELDAAGVETRWGEVAAFEPPGRLLLVWQFDKAMTYDPAIRTEVEVTFTAIEGGGTRVRLEHRDLDRYGADARRMADLVGPGWASIVRQYAASVDAPTQAAFVVHAIPGSPYARAVMATLVEKGVPWRLAPLPPGAQRQPAHLALHPFGRVPVLEHGDLRLYETQAILRYLDRVLPNPPLCPTDPLALARMDQVIGVNDSYLFRGCADVIVFQRVVRPRLLGLTTDEAAIETAMPQARAVFSELARLLGDERYFGGDDVTLADLMVAPQLDTFALTPEWVALTAHDDALPAYLERMRERCAMRATTTEKVVALAGPPARAAA